MVAVKPHAIRKFGYPTNPQNPFIKTTKTISFLNSQQSSILNFCPFPSVSGPFKHNQARGGQAN